MFHNAMSNFKHNSFHNCPFHARTPVLNKIGQGKVKDVNVDSHSYDSLVFTKTR